MIILIEKKGKWDEETKEEYYKEAQWIIVGIVIGYGLVKVLSWLISKLVSTN